MKKPIRIDLDGPYYPKMTRWQRAWNWAIAALILFGVVCFYF